MDISNEKKNFNDITSSSAVLVSEAIRIQPKQERIHHYFIFSLISSICLCPATGLIALAYSLKSSAKADVNFHDKARRYSRYALIWNIISVILVIALIFFTVFCYETNRMNTDYFYSKYQQQRYNDIHRSIQSITNN
ncbi:unnamed protein product [Rotaria sp. Silwood1]|nr:unnamed protein product [Rotaria sp. Silwood1]CAF1060026.1 unnamed protein product [Rotaria sp. Silwood1]